MHHQEGASICLFAIGICYVPFSSSLSSPSLLSLSSSALCIVLCCRCLIYYEIRTWLLVFQMLSAQAIISNSPGCRKKKKNERRKCNAPPAEKLLIDTHSGGTLATLAQLPFPYSFCHFSAKFDLYRFYYICFFATPMQPLPLIPLISGHRPWLFLLFRVALMNSNVCVIELLKFH